MRFFRFISLAALLLVSSHPWAAAATRILFLGDSLTEGLGVSSEDAYPILVGQQLRQHGYDVEVVNGGVSGSTTSSGVSRLRWHLKAKPDLVVLALGANDALRGIAPAPIKKNLSDVIALAAQNHVRVLLAGMKAPPNYGASYASCFERIYPELARQYHVTLLPFLLNGVAGEAGLNQADGIHPNPEGHRRIAEAMTKALQPLLSKKAS